ncbi:zinc finger protein 99-like [Spodoptera frugiperda]|uniref:Zinc finger protein 99-like n=1 Tax=Spodoptera frugiperda TaxID=7108 RepID=A0A9R0CXH1_SPOFR|nr:zinc finger protein 99-like [Spodoptera frugiperda]
MKLELKPMIKLQKLAIHICDKCKEVFRNPSDLEEHACHYDKRFYEHVASAYVSVERMPIHRCDRCDQNFKTNTEYLLHKFKHVQANVRKSSPLERKPNRHIFKPYKCPDCDIRFAAQSTLDLHSIVHRPYQHVCYCGVGYYKQIDLKAHIKLVHRNNKAIEEIKSGNNSIPMMAQTVTETPKAKKPLKSVLVKKKKNFKNNVEIKSPKNGRMPKKIKFIKTDDNKYYKCPICSDLFKSNFSVSVHYRVHFNNRVHACFMCSKVMSTTGTLRLHMKEHHNTLKICVCKYCSKTYVAYANLTRHERIHLKDKSLSKYYRHKCSYCNKPFSDATTLRAHMMIHGNDLKKKAYICNNCKLGFKFKCNLVTHIVSGVCEKPYECDYCHMKFVRKKNVRKHILNVHMKTKNWSRIKVK